MSRYDYEAVERIVRDRGCRLNMSNNEFNETYTGVKSNIKIISSCGCNTLVQFNNFLYSKTGVSIAILRSIKIESLEITTYKSLK